MTDLDPSIADATTYAPVATTSAIDQVVQYRQICFALHTLMLQVSTIVSSSNGTTTAGAGNNIASAADIVFNTGATNHAWATYFLGGNTYVQFDFNADAADLTPQLVTAYICQAAYTGGSLTTRPSPSVADRESSAFAISLVPWAAPVAGHFTATWSPAAQIFYFLVKQDGAAYQGITFFIERPVAGDEVFDGVRDWYMGTLTGNGIATTIRMPGIDGTAGIATGTQYSFEYSASGNTNGQYADGRTRRSTILVGANSNVAEDRRCAGYMRLQMAHPLNLPLNDEDSSDPPADLWTWKALGANSYLWLKSHGDMP